MGPHAALVGDFPGLNDHNSYSITSPQDEDYNCIAWAAGDSDRWWWPDIDGYWPPAVPREDSVDGFIKAFESLGFSVCNTDSVEANLEKVAIYARNGRAKHAARQLPDGNWTSKLGESYDISHRTLAAIEGVNYGECSVILSRPR